MSNDCSLHNSSLPKVCQEKSKYFLEPNEKNAGYLVLPLNADTPIVCASHFDYFVIILRTLILFLPEQNGGSSLNPTNIANHSAHINLGYKAEDETVSVKVQEVGNIYD